MTIEQAQIVVDNWIKTTGVRYFNELTNMAMLTEEVGEVARIIARRYGEQSEKESDKSKVLADELADVLFVVICLANQTGFPTSMLSALAKSSIFSSILSAILWSHAARSSEDVALHFVKAFLAETMALMASIGPDLG